MLLFSWGQYHVADVVSGLGANPGIFPCSLHNLSANWQPNTPTPILKCSNTQETGKDIFVSGYVVFDKLIFPTNLRNINSRD